MLVVGRGFPLGEVFARCLSGPLSFLYPILRGCIQEWSVFGRAPRHRNTSFTSDWVPLQARNLGAIIRARRQQHQFSARIRSLQSVYFFGSLRVVYLLSVGWIRTGQASSRAHLGLELGLVRAPASDGMCRAVWWPLVVLPFARPDPQRPEGTVAGPPRTRSPTMCGRGTPTGSHSACRLAPTTRRAQDRGRTGGGCLLCPARFDVSPVDNAIM